MLFFAFESKQISFCSYFFSICFILTPCAASESSPCGENHGSVPAKTCHLLLQPALQGIKMIMAFILITTTLFCSLFSNAGRNNPSLNAVLPSIGNAELLQGCAALQEAKYVEMHPP